MCFEKTDGQASCVVDNFFPSSQTLVAVIYVCLYVWVTGACRYMLSMCDHAEVDVKLSHSPPYIFLVISLFLFYVCWYLPKFISVHYMHAVPSKDRR